MKFKFFLVLVLLASTLAVFWFYSKPNSPSSVTNIRVRLGWVHQAQFAGFYVAKEKGFYSEVGLNVDLLPADSTVNQVSELSDNAVEASVMEAHQLVSDYATNSSLQAVAAIYQINPHALAVRSDSAIRGPQDFGGKVIGRSGGASEGDSIFNVFIDSLNLSVPVNYKDLGFNTVDDFLNNRADIIDVYRIDQPYLAEKMGIPLRIIPLDAYGFSTYGDVLVMNKSFIDLNKDETRNFVRATLRGWKYALDNPNEAVDITLKYAVGDYADKDYENHILVESIPLIRGEKNAIGSMEIVPWSILYEYLDKEGLIETPFNIKDIYTNDYIY